MIGHNPKTPGGLGLGVGYTVPIEQLIDKPQGQPYIVVASKIIDFELIAQLINAYCKRGYDIRAAILQPMTAYSLTIDWIIKFLS